jgi:hypothetical protein
MNKKEIVKYFLSMMKEYKLIQYEKYSPPKAEWYLPPTPNYHIISENLLCRVCIEILPKDYNDMYHRLMTDKNLKKYKVSIYPYKEIKAKLRRAAGLKVAVLLSKP